MTTDPADSSFVRAIALAKARAPIVRRPSTKALRLPDNIIHALAREQGRVLTVLDAGCITYSRIWFANGAAHCFGGRGGEAIGRHSVCVPLT